MGFMRRYPLRKPACQWRRPLRTCCISLVIRSANINRQSIWPGIWLHSGQAQPRLMEKTASSSPSSGSHAGKYRGRGRSQRTFADNHINIRMISQGASEISMLFMIKAEQTLPQGLYQTTSTRSLATSRCRPRRISQINDKCSSGA